MVGDEIDRGASEAAAGQAGAEASGVLAGQFDEDIQFLGAVLQKIARALVALKHVLAKLPVIVFAQGAGARHDSGDLADHMAGALEFALGQSGFAGVHLIKLD